MNKKTLIIGCIFLLSVLVLSACDNINTNKTSDTSQNEEESEIFDVETGIDEDEAEPEIFDAENDGGSGADSADDFQSGQVALEALPYESNKISHEGDTDFYKFTVKPGDWFEVKVIPDKDLDVKVKILDSGGKDFTWDFTYRYGGSSAGKNAFDINSGIAGKEESFWSQMGSDKAGYTYYFSVSSVKGLGSYKIILEVKPQNDANSEGDAGEKPSKSVEIASGHAYTGLLNWNDDMDCYKLSTGSKASVTVAPSTDLDASFKVHDSGGKDVTWDLTYYKKTNKNKNMFSVNDAAAGLAESIEWQTDGAVQYICIKKEGGSGEYTITYS